MFVQVIEAQVRDRDGLRRQLDRWEQELRPGATGFLGSTSGVTDDGHMFAVARFESAAAAKANNDRAEQGKWWAETEATLEGEATFTESEDVDPYLAGGSNDAGFVQVIKGSGVDRDRVHEMDERFFEHAASFRPDLIGGIRIWTGPDNYIDVAYFTSEAAAREGEKKEAPPELAADMAEFETMMADVEFLDLREPWLR